MSACTLLTRDTSCSERRKKQEKQNGSAQHQREEGVPSEALVPSSAAGLQRVCLCSDAIPIVARTTEGEKLIKTDNQLI